MRGKDVRSLGLGFAIVGQEKDGVFRCGIHCAFIYMTSPI